MILIDYSDARNTFHLIFEENRRPETYNQNGQLKV